MNFSKIIFPAPMSSYTCLDPDLIWIPKEEDSNFLKNLFCIPKKQTELIPGFFIPYTDKKTFKGSKNVLVYFHANGEDLGISYELLIHLQQQLKINIYSMEYKGYGVYEGQSSEKSVLENSYLVIKYLIKQFGFNERNIFVIGRSIGTGPATHVASIFKNIGGLILISPFSSIKDVASQLFGDKISILISDQFNNLKKIKQIQCPLFIIHGKEDELIPIEQSEILLSYSNSKINGYKFPQKMTHNKFNILKDIIIPIKAFFQSNKIDLYYQGPLIKIDQSLYNNKQLQKQNNQSIKINKQIKKDNNEYSLSSNQTKSTQNINQKDQKQKN